MDYENQCCFPRARALSYSVFMAGLKHAGIEVDRKVLAEIAVHEKDAFRALAERVKTQIEAKAA